jgi:demethylmenaquinone methyltransferase/2-methoxy-6-polyprenyl-1,4-benzoquinol methylase
MSKKIKSLFDYIASRYDLLNHLLSAGRHITWRRKAVGSINENLKAVNVLDICGGSGDFYIALEKAAGVISGVGIIGDMSFNMLRQARKKTSSPTLICMDTLYPPFKPGSFQLVLCGFGMRNLDSLQKGSKEIYNLLEPNGEFITLEFFKPESLVSRLVFYVISPLVMPLLGGLIAGSKSAYSYLFCSVKSFLSVKEYITVLNNTGFSMPRVLSCDFGISHIITAEKVKINAR